MNQTELAEALSVSQAGISKWGKNQLTICGINLIKLSKFFEVSVDELLGYTGIIFNG